MQFPSSFLANVCILLFRLASGACGGPGLIHFRTPLRTSVHHICTQPPPTTPKCPLLRGTPPVITEFAAANSYQCTCLLLTPHCRTKAFGLSLLEGQGVVGTPSPGFSPLCQHFVLFWIIMAGSSNAQHGVAVVGHARNARPCLQMRTSIVWSSEQVPVSLQSRSEPFTPLEAIHI